MITLIELGGTRTQGLSLSGEGAFATVEVRRPCGQLALGLGALLGEAALFVGEGRSSLL